MRYTPTVLTSLAIASILTGLSRATRPINVTAALELPDCVKQCGATILPKYDCQVGDDCWCERNGPLVDELSECVLSGCPELREAIEGLKFQAITCEYPMDRNLAALTNGVAYTLFGLTTFFLLARFLSRWPALHGAGLSWDDALSLLCFIPVVGMTVAVAKEAHYGSGRDSWTLQIEEVIHYAKLSLIALYLRVWPSGPNQRYPMFRCLCWIMAFVLSASAIACSLAMIFACRPLSNAWKYADTGNGTCINRVGAAYAYGGLNVLFDIVVIALPIPKLVRLDVSKRQKIGIISCFLVGLVATGCSIVRLFTLHSLTTARNITWDFTYAGFWSIVEVYCSMICCCMPAMAGLINRALRRVGDTSLRSSRRTRISSFEMAHPTNRGGEDTDLDTMDPKSPSTTSKLPDDPEDTWASSPPLRRFTIKGGALVQQTTDNDDGSR